MVLYIGIWFCIEENGCFSEMSPAFQALCPPNTVFVLLFGWDMEGGVYYKTGKGCTIYFLLSGQVSRSKVSNMYRLSLGEIIVKEIVFHSYHSLLLWSSQYKVFI